MPAVRPCNVPVQGATCPYPRLVLPTGGLSPMCAWHRLARTSMEAQIREAARRLGAAQDAGRPARARVAPSGWPTGERWCAGCQSFVPLFYCTGSRCRACAAKAARASYRKSKYGLSEGDFDAIMAEQDGRCAMCRKRQTDRAIATDHNHKTAKVRGALCKRCNHDILGSAFESVRLLLAGAVYLVVPPTSEDWIDPLSPEGDYVYRTFLKVVDRAVRMKHEREGAARSRGDRAAPDGDATPADAPGQSERATRTS